MKQLFFIIIISLLLSLIIIITTSPPLNSFVSATLQIKKFECDQNTRKLSIDSSYEPDPILQRTTAIHIANVSNCEVTITDPNIVFSHIVFIDETIRRSSALTTSIRLEAGTCTLKNVYEDEILNSNLTACVNFKSAIEGRLPRGVIVTPAMSISVRNMKVDPNKNPMQDLVEKNKIAGVHPTFEFFAVSFVVFYAPIYSLSQLDISNNDFSFSRSSSQGSESPLLEINNPKAVCEYRFLDVRNSIELYDETDPNIRTEASNFYIVTNNTMNFSSFGISGTSRAQALQANLISFNRDVGAKTTSPLPVSSSSPSSIVISRSLSVTGNVLLVNFNSSGVFENYVIIRLFSSSLLNGFDTVSFDRNYLHCTGSVGKSAAVYTDLVRFDHDVTARSLAVVENTMMFDVKTEDVSLRGVSTLAGFSLTISQTANFSNNRFVLESQYATLEGCGKLTGVSSTQFCSVVIPLRLSADLTYCGRFILSENELSVAVNARIFASLLRVGAFETNSTVLIENNNISFDVDYLRYGDDHQVQDDNDQVGRLEKMSGFALVAFSFRDIFKIDPSNSIFDGSNNNNIMMDPPPFFKMTRNLFVVNIKNMGSFLGDEGRLYFASFNGESTPHLNPSLASNTFDVTCHASTRHSLSIQQPSTVAVLFFAVFRPVLRGVEIILVNSNTLFANLTCGNNPSQYCKLYLVYGELAPGFQTVGPSSIFQISKNQFTATISSFGSLVSSSLFFWSQGLSTAGSVIAFVDNFTIFQNDVRITLSPSLRTNSQLTMGSSTRSSRNTLVYFDGLSLVNVDRIAVCNNRFHISLPRQTPKQAKANHLGLLIISLLTLSPSTSSINNINAFNFSNNDLIADLQQRAIDSTIITGISVTGAIGVIEQYLTYRHPLLLTVHNNHLEALDPPPDDFNENDNNHSHNNINVNHLFSDEYDFIESSSGDVINWTAAFASSSTLAQTAQTLRYQPLLQSQAMYLMILQLHINHTLSVENNTITMRTGPMTFAAFSVACILQFTTQHTRDSHSPFPSSGDHSSTNIYVRNNAIKLFHWSSSLYTMKGNVVAQIVDNRAAQLTTGNFTDYLVEGNSIETQCRDFSVDNTNTDDDSNNSVVVSCARTVQSNILNFEGRVDGIARFLVRNNTVMNNISFPTIWENVPIKFMKEEENNTMIMTNLPRRVIPRVSAGLYFRSSIMTAKNHLSYFAEFEVSHNSMSLLIEFDQNVTKQLHGLNYSNNNNNTYSSSSDVAMFNLEEWSSLRMESHAISRVFVAFTSMLLCSSVRIVDNSLLSVTTGVLQVTPHLSGIEGELYKCPYFLVSNNSVHIFMEAIGTVQDYERYPAYANRVSSTASSTSPSDSSSGNFLFSTVFGCFVSIFGDGFKSSFGILIENNRMVIESGSVIAQNFFRIAEARSVYNFRTSIRFINNQIVLGTLTREQPQISAHVISNRNRLMNENNNSKGIIFLNQKPVSTTSIAIAQFLGPHVTARASGVTSVPPDEEVLFLLQDNLVCTTPAIRIESFAELKAIVFEMPQPGAPSIFDFVSFNLTNNKILMANAAVGNNNNNKTASDNSHSSAAAGALSFIPMAVVADRMKLTIARLPRGLSDSSFVIIKNCSIEASNFQVHPPAATAGYVSLVAMILQIGEAGFFSTFHCNFIQMFRNSIDMKNIASFTESEVRNDGGATVKKRDGVALMRLIDMTDALLRTGPKIRTGGGESETLFVVQNNSIRIHGDFSTGGLEANVITLFGVNGRSEVTYHNNRILIGSQTNNNPSSSSPIPAIGVLVDSIFNSINSVSLYSFAMILTGVQKFTVSHSTITVRNMVDFRGAAIAKSLLAGNSNNSYNYNNGSNSVSCSLPHVTTRNTVMFTVLSLQNFASVDDISSFHIVNNRIDVFFDPSLSSFNAPQNNNNNNDHLDHPLFFFFFFFVNRLDSTVVRSSTSSRNITTIFNVSANIINVKNATVVNALVNYVFSTTGSLINIHHFILSLNSIIVSNAHTVPHEMAPLGVFTVDAKIAYCRGDISGVSAATSLLSSSSFSIFGNAISIKDNTTGALQFFLAIFMHDQALATRISSLCVQNNHISILDSSALRMSHQNITSPYVSSSGIYWFFSQGSWRNASSALILISGNSIVTRNSYLGVDTNVFGVSFHQVDTAVAPSASLPRSPVKQFIVENNQFEIDRVFEKLGRPFTGSDQFALVRLRSFEPIVELLSLSSNVLKFSASSSSSSSFSHFKSKFQIWVLTQSGSFSGPVFSLIARNISLQVDSRALQRSLTNVVGIIAIGASNEYSSIVIENSNVVISSHGRSMITHRFAPSSSEIFLRDEFKAQALVSFVINLQGAVAETTTVSASSVSVDANAMIILVKEPTQEHDVESFRLVSPFFEIILALTVNSVLKSVSFRSSSVQIVVYPVTDMLPSSKCSSLFEIYHQEGQGAFASSLSVFELADLSSLFAGKSVVTADISSCSVSLVTSPSAATSSSSPPSPCQVAISNLTRSFEAATSLIFSPEHDLINSLAPSTKLVFKIRNRNAIHGGTNNNNNNSNNNRRQQRILNRMLTAEVSFLNSGNTSNPHFLNGTTWHFGCDNLWNNSVDKFFFRHAVATADSITYDCPINKHLSWSNSQSETKSTTREVTPPKTSSKTAQESLSHSDRTNSHSFTSGELNGLSHSQSSSAATQTSSDSEMHLPPPPPTFPAPELVVAAVSIVSALSAAPHSAGFLQRVKAMSSLENCGKADAGEMISGELPPLSFDSSPISMRVGKDSRLRSPRNEFEPFFISNLAEYSGSLVGNCVIVLAILFLQIVVSWLLAGPLNYKPSFKAALMTTRFPGAAIIVMLVFVTPTAVSFSAVAMSMSQSVIKSDRMNAQSIFELAISGLLYCVIPCAVLLWIGTILKTSLELTGNPRESDSDRNNKKKSKKKKSSSSSRRKKKSKHEIVLQLYVEKERNNILSTADLDIGFLEKLKNDTGSLVAYLIDPWYSWIVPRVDNEKDDDDKKDRKKKSKRNPPASDQFLERYGDAFEAFCVPFFAFLDYFLAMCIGLISGAMLLPQTRSTCFLASIACLCLAIFRLLVTLIQKPFTTRLDSIFGVVASLLECMSAVSALLAVLGKSFDFGGSEVGLVGAILALVAAAGAFLPRFNKFFRVIRRAIKKIRKVFRKKSSSGNKNGDKKKKKSNSNSNNDTKASKEQKPSEKKTTKQKEEGTKNKSGSQKKKEKVTNLRSLDDDFNENENNNNNYEMARFSPRNDDRADTSLLRNRGPPGNREAKAAVSSKSKKPSNRMRTSRRSAFRQDDELL